MTSTADIVIIGAGLHGASLAYHLAKAGAGSVVVLEKKHVAAGPTAKSGAMIRPLFSDAIYIRLVLEATAMFEQWDDVIGGDAGFVQNSFLRFTESFDQPTLGADLDLMTRLGAPFELIAPADLPGLASSCVFSGSESGVLLTKGALPTRSRPPKASSRRLSVWACASSKTPRSPASMWPRARCRQW